VTTLHRGTGVVIGETAVVGDNVSILQGVTLGGTGKDVGDRHPKIGKGVLIGGVYKLNPAVTHSLNAPGFNH
jgi:serine acetyltransferase